MTVSSTSTDLESYLQSTREERLASYTEFLRIPSISALPQHSGDCRRAAEWLAAELRRLGAEHVEVSETEAHPIVYADWLHAEGAPTAIVYGHYDVQPVDPLELWESPPFEPVLKADRVLARGAADDKAQIRRGRRGSAHQGRIALLCRRRRDRRPA